jgi:toxin ParE1/3/4
MRVIFTPQAARHLEEVGSYIARHNPDASKRLIHRILSHCSKLKDHSLIGRPGRVAETRELVVPGTRFVVPYRVRNGRIEILAILHAARDWPEGF